jgi:hypothetical protein
MLSLDLEIPPQALGEEAINPAVREAPLNRIA